MRSFVAAGMFITAFATAALAALPQVRPKHSPITIEDRAFWAFQPVKDVSPPDAKSDSWCRNPIDQFILSNLREHGLGPSKQADRVTLIHVGAPETLSAEERTAVRGCGVRLVETPIDEVRLQGDRIEAFCFAG